MQLNNVGVLLRIVSLPRNSCCFVCWEREIREKQSKELTSRSKTEFIKIDKRIVFLNWYAFF